MRNICNALVTRVTPRMNHTEDYQGRCANCAVKVVVSLISDMIDFNIAVRRAIAHSARNDSQSMFH